MPGPQRFATAPQTITQIKCMGERRSGSRFIKQLISLNVDVELLSLEGGDEADAGSAENGKKRTVITRGKLPPAVDRLYAADYSRSLGWRHACAPTQSQFEEHHVTSALLHRTLFVFVAKNPYAWLVSLYNNLTEMHVDAPPPPEAHAYTERLLAKRRQLLRHEHQLLFGLSPCHLFHAESLLQG